MNWSRFILVFISLASIYFPANGQTYSVSGSLHEQTDTIPVIGGVVQLVSRDDSTQIKGTVTDDEGNFSITGVSPGNYSIVIKYIGTQSFRQHITVLDQNIHLGNIVLIASNNVLETVVIQGQQLKVQQLGDTTQFNAGAYKVNQDASAEDLVTKMPGITTEGGTVKVNGEEVRQILVDGKPFFGDDPNVALKNLPAEVIDKIQVFDRLSDQAQFTGFDDGNTSKSINIITKKGKNTGQFGKIYAGYGTNDRYNAGGNINIFNGAQRISILGLSNNINQQNFSSEDLLGVSEGSGGRGRGGYGGAGRSGRSGGGRSSGRGGSENFLIGNQNGISTTHSVGLNYSDEWSDRIKVTGSYFFNATDNVNTTELSRRYFNAADSGLVYDEQSNTGSRNRNHRFNLRFEYEIDSFNSLIVTPRFSYQHNDYTTSLFGSSRLGDNSVMSNIINNNQSVNKGYTFNNDIQFRHRFAKKGRTASLNINTQLNERDGDGKIYSLNQYSDSDTTLLDQQYDLYSNGHTVSGNLVYTEPVGKSGQLMVNYNPSYTKSRSDKETYDFNNAEQQYNLFNNLLSNKFDNTYTTQRGGLSYRYNNSLVNAMAGVNGQQARLEGEQFFPYAFRLSKTFTNILPHAMLNLRFSQSSNLRLNYRTSTNPPNITQLQNVVDITNPLLLRTGNPDLQQDYTHTLNFRYGNTKASKGQSFFMFANGSYVMDYIGNATYIPVNDTAVEGITVKRGSQLTRPVNLDGYYSARTFFTYGLPLNFIKSNLNLNAGFSYSHAPSLINQLTNYSNNHTISGGLVISSNISENLDFTLSYTPNYSIVKNTVQTQSDNTYYSHNASFRINYIFLDHFVVNTNLVHTQYSGLTQSFNQQFLLWNAYIGYKFLKDRSLEARISAYDILNQNRSISRNITDVYIEDSRTQVLTQYFLFSLTYTLRNFKGGMNPAETDNSAAPADAPRRRGGGGNDPRGGQ